MKDQTIDQLLAAYETSGPKDKQRIRKELRRRGTSIRAPLSEPPTPLAPAAKLKLIKGELSKKEREHLSVAQCLTLVAEMWNAFNTTEHFDKPMQVPHFKIITARRKLGTWAPGSRTLSITARLIRFAADAELRDTVLHEMAHQYVSDILKMYGEKHGPTWKQIARRAGCRPASKTAGPVQLDSDREVALKTKAKEEHESLVKLAGHRKLNGSEIRCLVTAQYFEPSSKTWIKGMIADRNDRKGRRWAFLPVGSTSSNRWKVIPWTWFHEWKMPAAGDSQDKLKMLCLEIVAHHKAKQERRREIKGWRNAMYGED